MLLEIPTRTLQRECLRNYDADYATKISYEPARRDIPPNAVQTNALKNNYTGDDKLGLFQVLIPISVVGWTLCGAACILCINGRGKAGRWVPEWYLDSQGTRTNKTMVVLWWLAVMLLWPLILPLLMVRKCISRGQKILERDTTKESRIGCGKDYEANTQA